MAPTGWPAASAGRLPEGELSDNARRVLAKSAATAWVVEGAARSVELFPKPEHIIAIDSEVANALQWTLDRDDPDGIAEELRRRVRDLVGRPDPRRLAAPE